MPRYYPMMLDIKGRTCVVVGGGDVAARKVEMLVECGAVVKAVAPRLDASLNPLIDSGKLIHINGEYAKGHLKGAALAIGATDNEKVNRAVYDDAVEIGIPVNIVDVPEICNFIVPSVVERGDLIIAISTSGKSPAMAKNIRRKLEKEFGQEYEDILKLLGDIRPILMEREPDLKKRMAILTGIVNSDLLERLRSGEKPSAEEIVTEALKQ